MVRFRAPLHSLADENASAPMAAMFGSSLALSISDIPTMVRLLGFKWPMPQKISSSASAADKKFTFRLDSGEFKEAINMVESGAQELSEDIMLQYS